ncbi:MAG6450 family protein [Mycoplasma capricolum]|uniref:MAG6450 family protein n=1 Tax=Mycoplasma capricolum TaxID=2095 RepID=UPI003DA3735C
MLKLKDYIWEHILSHLKKRWVKQLEIREIHLGKDRNPFRLFGYLNKDNYFVLTKIDPNHEYYD